MMNRHIFYCYVLFLMLLMIGCTSDKEKLEVLCGEIHKASLMTNDCEAMAGYLAPRTEEYQAIVKHLSESQPEASKRLEYVDVISVCLRNYLEIQTGTCKDNESVKKALPYDELRTRN